MYNNHKKLSSHDMDSSCACMRSWLTGQLTVSHRETNLRSVKLRASQFADNKVVKITERLRYICTLVTRPNPTLQLK